MMSGSPAPTLFVTAVARHPQQVVRRVVHLGNALQVRIVADEESVRKFERISAQVQGTT
jgi:hypothetical protein